MFNVTRLLDVDPAHRSRLASALRDAASASGAHRVLVEPTDPGSRNGGDVLVHLRFTEELQWTENNADFTGVLQDPAITRINGVSYRGAPDRITEGGSVYRTLLLRVDPGVEPATITRFERELRAMPHYVHTIRSWQLSPVVDAVGTSAWTHVFEQEFTDVDGLMGPYLMHPIHWAVVDRWFDPETTDVIIRDRVCHSFCAISSPVLS